MRVDKDPSQVRIDGGEYEFKLAGLVTARMRAERRRHPELKIRFFMATNMEGANPFDDLILHIEWEEDSRNHTVNYFMQLKHATRSDKFVNKHYLTSKRISKRTKDFNLRKYFQFFQKLEEIKDSPLDNLNHNQILLKEMAQEDCRFILFTTREVLPGNIASGRKSPMRFPFDNVFDTGQGDILSFGDEIPEIWNMFEEPESSLFQNHFLPRFRVYGGQIYASQLDSLLQSALIEAIGAPVPRSNVLISQYLRYLRQWWDSPDGQCLTESSTELLEIIKYLVNSSMESVSLEFKPRFYLDNRSLLQDYQVSYNIVYEISTRLRCAKLRPILNEMCPGRYMILADNTFRDFPETALESVCESVCDELVLNVNQVNEKQRNFIKKILVSKVCNVRLVQSELDEDLFNLLKSISPKCEVLPDRYWTIEHLAEHEQERIMGKRITFQGHEVILKDLEIAWPSLRRGLGGATLDALICEDSIELGAPLPPLDYFYLPRNLEHRAALRKSVLEIKSSSNHFLLSGFPQKELEKLRSPTSPWEECELLVEDYQQSCNTEVTDGKKKMPDILKIEKSTWSPWCSSESPDLQYFAQNKNIHWLSFEDNEILWNDTCGQYDILLPYIKNRGHMCQNTPVCVHQDATDFIDWKGKFVLTSDPGMGKSTFITRLAHELKTEHPTQWVVLMRLNEGKLLEKLTVVNPESVVDLLERTVNIRNPSVRIETKNFIRDCLTETSHISVLIDGVDDVCPTYKETFLSFLQLLCERLRPARVWVSARVLLQPALALATACPPFALQPFSQEDQQRYLLAHWGQGEEGFESVELKSTVEQLVGDVRQATQHGGRSLCDVPLYANMLAVAYKEEHATWTQSTDSWKALSSKYKAINLMTLIQKFVQETRKVYWERAGVPVDAIINHRWASKLDTEFRKEHQKCAVFLSLNDGILLGDLHHTIEKDVQELASDMEREKTGLITNFVDGKPQFIHRVFVEYFSAQWLVENYTLLPREKLRAIFSENYDELRYFFDALLSQGYLLHEAALEGGVVAMRTALKKLLRARRRTETGPTLGATVLAVAGDEAAAALAEAVSAVVAATGAEAEDRGGRRALHLAAAHGREAAARLLLEDGCEVQARDRVMGWTPLRYADAALRLSPQGLPSAHLAVAERLLRSGADPADAPAIRAGGRALLAVAIERDFAQVARMLVKAEGPLLVQRLVGRSSYLHVAAQHGSERSARMLLMLGFGVNEREPRSLRTPLHLAAALGHVALCEMLLQRGASVAARTRYRRTPLHEAAARGNEAACRLLLDAGANPFHRDIDGELPLDKAANWGAESPVFRLLASICDGMHVAMVSPAAEARLHQRHSRPDSGGVRDLMVTLRGPTNLERVASLVHRRTQRRRQRRHERQRTSLFISGGDH